MVLTFSFRNKIELLGQGAEQPEEVAPDRSSSQTCSETNNSSTAVQGSGNERRTSTRRLSTRALRYINNLTMIVW